MNKCNIENCEKNVIARGWCHTHYKRWQIHGDPLKSLHRKKCSVDQCNNKHSEIGFCSMHARRFRRHGDHNIVLCKKQIYETNLDGYEQNVIKNENGCWDWKGKKSTLGYSWYYVNGKRIFAHRFSYEFYNGQILNNNEICHKCDNPSCTNPLHLFQATHKENIQDSIKKGRFKFVPNHLKAKGSNVSSAKLNEKNVVLIKKMIKDGIGNKEIAKKFNVVHGTISHIRVGKTWKHVQIEENLQ